MSDIPRKTLQELEAEYADVMGNKAVTDVTHFVPENNAPPFDEVEIKRRARRYAPEMQKVVQAIFQ